MPIAPSFDPDWLNREYNNRALVPEHAAMFERWARLSAAARQQGPALVDLRYGHGPNEQLDIFAPQGRRAGELAPVLFFVHGGYWRSLDKADHSFLAPEFTRRGACVVMPNYALCPAVTIPDIVMQMVQALAWTWRHIATTGATRAAFRWWATRPAGTWPPCCCCAAGPRWGPICRPIW